MCANCTKLKATTVADHSVCSSPFMLISIFTSAFSDNHNVNPVVVFTLSCTHCYVLVTQVVMVVSKHSEFSVHTSG